MSDVMEVKVYNQEGKESGTLKLKEKIFALPWNADLVHQVIRSENLSRRKNTAHAKDRSEVSGGGKKPWAQKGTGRARHGSIRSPLWIGGGVTHGPRNERNYERKVNRKTRKAALATLLSQKVRDNEVVFIDRLAFDEAKTKKGAEFLKNISKIVGFNPSTSESKTLLLLASPDKKILRSVRNLKNMDAKEAKNISTLDVVNYKFFIIPKESEKILEGIFIKTDSGNTDK